MLALPENPPKYMSIFSNERPSQRSYLALPSGWSALVLQGFFLNTTLSPNGLLVLHEQDSTQVAEFWGNM
jgi:hypothetical protein